MIGKTSFFLIYSVSCGMLQKLMLALLSIEGCLKSNLDLSLLISTLCLEYYSHVHTG